jgi:hypothetical protein
MRYIIDSNCFITPHRSFCPTDVGLSFWNKVKALANEGVICSIDKVKAELYVNSDELKDWMDLNIEKQFFLDFENEFSVGALTKIITWAKANRFYTPRAKEKFLKLDKADIYIASYASTQPSEWTVVSMERSAPESPGEIKLPDICARYNVKCIQLEEMFRELCETY